MDIYTMQEEAFKRGYEAAKAELVMCDSCKHHDHCEVEMLLRYVDRIENPYCAAGERKDNERKAD